MSELAQAVVTAKLQAVVTVMEQAVVTTMLRITVKAAARVKKVVVGLLPPLRPVQVECQAFPSSMVEVVARLLLSRPQTVCEPEAAESWLPSSSSSVAARRGAGEAAA